jgi:aquaporin Z
MAQLERYQAEWQRYAAELLGTFVLVFVGCTSIIGAQQAAAPVLLVAAFAFGIALLAGLYAFGEVSGGHFNPAVSLAMFLDKRLPVYDLIGYWVAQFVGGILAALVLLIGTSQDQVASTATVPGFEGDGTAFLMELVFTAIFVAVILQASTSLKFGSSALVAIPLTLVAVHLAAIPFSGSSVNPARTLGPDLVGNEWDGFLIYLIAPPLGAALAWAAHAFIVKGQVTPPEAAVAEVLEEPPPPAATATQER